MDYNEIVLTMPEITGDKRYYLVNNRVYAIGDGTPGVEFSKDAINFFFDSGIWLVEEEGAQEATDNEGDTQTPTSTTGGAQFTSTGAIASDGGSSSYYDIPVPDWLIDRIIERAEDGQAYVKTEELIEVVFQSDFDASNAFKSLVRLWGTFNGAGKAGNSLSYERKKIEYSVNKLQQRYERLEAV